MTPKVRQITLQDEMVQTHHDKVVWVMRYIAFLFIGLLLWGLADDILVGGLQPSPRGSANDDDEYLVAGGKRTPQRLAEQEKTPLSADVVPVGGRSTFVGASLPFCCPDLQALSCDSCLYVFMSLQI